LGQAHERLLSLEPNEPGTDAEVRAETECEVGCIAAFEVQPVWVGLVRRVAVRRSEHNKRLLAPVDLDATEDDIVSSDARGDLDRAVVAQELVHGLEGALGMLREPVELIRAFEQRDRAVADQARSRLMTCGEKQQAHRDDLVVLQRDATIRRMDQRAQ
jgi:hypothetical protein